MTQKTLLTAILFLTFMQFSSQDISSRNYSRYIDSQASSIQGRKFGRQNYKKKGGNNQPLCSQEGRSGEVAPCDDINMWIACFDPPSESFMKCKDVQLSLPRSVCIKHNSNQQFVVSCSKIPVHFCFTPNSQYKKLEYCQQSAIKTCLGKRHILQPCSKGRKKRQVPQLDTDAYYATCENCSLKVVMTVDEDNNETPVIEIKSEPLKKGKKVEKH